MLALNKLLLLALFNNTWCNVLCLLFFLRLIVGLLLVLSWRHVCLISFLLFLKSTLHLFLDTLLHESKAILFIITATKITFQAEVTNILVITTDEIELIVLLARDDTIVLTGDGCSLIDQS